MTLFRTARLAFFILVVALMIGPLYVLLVNAFKSQTEILTSPLSLPGDGVTLEYLWAAATSSSFNVIAAYGFTAFLVVAVNVVSVLVCGPAAYVVARGSGRRHKLTLFILVAGLFIPGQVLVIPVIYVLRTVGLMGTIPGLILFQVALTIPLSLFLFTAYIRSIPRELDEAAVIDGAGPFRTFWKVIFPLMKPAVATAVILHTIAIWSDYVNPQIILGTGSGLYTVTTGVYAAISKYSTDYTLVYPNLLLAILPIIVFFLVLQKQIVGGLTAGATKG
ncbi:MAG: carbohydrate ABC transporter permease [Microcella sp.]